MRLLINKPGMFVGVKRGMIIIREKGNKVGEVSPAQITRVIVTTRGASISTALLRLLATHKIPLIVYSSVGFPVIRAFPIKGGAIKLKKMQRDAQNSWKCAHIVKRIIWAKIGNQKAIIYHAAKARLRINPDVAKKLLEISAELSKFQRIVKGLEYDDLKKLRFEVIRIEAEAAEAYWKGFRLLLPEDVGFPGRKKRYDRPKDPVNILLNYGYGLLAGEVLLAVECSGLEPYMGFLHEDSSRRPALVMDLMEEFRQPVVDRVVLRLIRRLDLNKIIRDGRLSRDARWDVIKAFYERLDEKVTFKNRSVPIIDHILLQARRLALFIMDKAPRYEPYIER